MALSAGECTSQLGWQMVTIREERELMNAGEIDRILNELTSRILECRQGEDPLVLVGIRRRGVPLAERLACKIEAARSCKVEVGTIDVNLYCDDLTLAHENPLVSAVRIPTIADRDVILVDDVLYSGRTVHAAMSAVLGLGLPNRVQLLVLVDRGHRRLPIEAQFVGRIIGTEAHHIIGVKLKEVDGVDRLALLARSWPIEMESPRA
jgi:pyrimidine operon attenuation protein/uracil phosphoribosyltransferase